VESFRLYVSRYLAGLCYKSNRLALAKQGLNMGGHRFDSLCNLENIKIVKSILNANSVFLLWDVCNLQISQISIEIR
jgi:hypothetical protein